MRIIYIFTIVLIYILFILIPKTNKKQNIILWLNISWILILCYNTLICLIYSIIGILCTMTTLSIANILILLILSTILIKTKKVQKYYIKIQDIIFTIIILMLVAFIAYKQYGFPLNINYITTDASTHYFFAGQFYENSTLLFNGNNDVLGIYNTSFRLPGAYVNEGILYKTFDNILSIENIFILFDLSVLYLSGMLFYYLLSTHAKENMKMQILAMIFSIMYMLGYQLNSMLAGYVYLSLALDIILALLILITITKKEEIKTHIILPILSLISFGIFFTYAYFIPIIYIAIIIYLIKESKESNTKIFSIENIINVIYLIIIPMILGVCYFIIFPLAKDIQSEIQTIGVDGVIYTNYITNYLAFIPIYIVGIFWVKKGERKNNYGVILFIISIIFAVILYIGRKLEIVSNYYFFKAYYIIWMLAIYTLYVIINTSNTKVKQNMAFIYILIYMLLVIIFTLVIRENIGINDIFEENFHYINQYDIILKEKELNIIEYVKQKKIDVQDIYILPSANNLKSQWMCVLYENQYIYINNLTYEFSNIENWIFESKEKYYVAYYSDYIIIFDKQQIAEEIENNDKYEIIYQDEYGFVLERKIKWK